MTVVDPYFDESTGTLRNLLNASSAEELAELEAQIAFANELELSALSISRTNDLEELLSIHRQIFKGIYDWAGQLRTVDIRKPDDSSFFLPVSKIREASLFVFNELHNERLLAGLTIDEFIPRIAHHYDQLNYIHPFREGNGRTQRIFWSRVALDAGYFIDWSAVSGEENDRASRLAAEDTDTSALVAMFSKITTTIE